MIAIVTGADTVVDIATKAINITTQIVKKKKLDFSLIYYLYAGEKNMIECRKFLPTFIILIYTFNLYWMLRKIDSYRVF